MAAGSSHWQLHALDYQATEHDAPSIGAETSHGPTYDARTPSLEFQDHAGCRCQDSSISQFTTQIDLSTSVGHPSRGPDASQQGSFLLGDSEICDSLALGETRDDEPGNGLERTALDQSAQHLPPGWTDFYFRPLFLVSLSVFLILTIVVLELVYHISQHNQGLVTASEDMHYAWTYGPTFVLTMIAALWGQLEQRAKQIMPWCLMSRGEAPAQNSLMLNYVTSSMPGSLFRSLRRKHFLVSIGICGSIILRLMIIFASGLLRLEYRPLIFDTRLIVKDVFSPTKNVNNGYRLLPGINNLNYWAILKYGLSRPHGTTSQYAVQTFTASDDGVYDKLTGEVQVFESSLENCDSFEFTYNHQGSVYPYEISMSVATPSSVLAKLRPWCHASYPTFKNVVDGDLLSFLNMTQMIYKCTNSTSVEDQDHRILLSWEYWLSSDESEVSGFMCEPRHSLTRRVVTNSTRNVGVQDSLDITEATTEILDIGIKPFNMTDNIMTSLRSNSEISIVEWTQWYTMLNFTRPQNNMWSFRNASLVIELSQHSWKDLAAYVVKQDYTTPCSEIINGTAESTQGRLCMQELSLRLVEAHGVLLIAITVALCFSRPGALHRDPTSLGAHAMILARSPGLVNFLKGYGVASKQILREKLSGYLASFPQHLPIESAAISFRQVRERPEAIAEKLTADHSDLNEWWSPVPVRWWFRICLMTALLAVMIALEVLLQISNRGNGLGDVSLGGYLKYTWSFLPTLALVLVGLLLSMVDSTARTLYPFQLLRKGRATPDDMLHDPARQVSLMAVAYAAWKCRFALLWATLPALLAPILTIIASGLYTVAPVPLTYDTKLELKDWFRPEYRTMELTNWVREDDSEAITTIILIHFSNMSYPKWTQGEYALASFGTGNLHSHDNKNTSLSITARVPATRANLNCSLIGHYNNDSYIYSATQPSAAGSKWLPVDPRPLGCHTTSDWNRTVGRRDVYLKVDNTKDSSSGYNIALLMDDYENMVCQRDDHCPVHFIGRESSSIRICGDRRQHHFIGLQYSMEAMSILHCVPYVEALWVNATFALPDLSLATDVPVTPDRDSSVFLSDSASMTAFPFGYWDKSVEAIVTSSLGVEQLTGLSTDPHSKDTRRVIAAVENIFAKYLAQHLHLNYRQPVGEYRNASVSPAGRNLLTPDGQPATGTVTDRTRLRLIQNTVSTRILEGLLAVMGACLVASTALGRGARVIPRDPGSVASRMAYFAGGDVWRRVPVGADRWTDEQIRKHGLGVPEGRLRLGWWGGDGREVSEEGARGKRFAVDVVGCKEAA